MKANTLSKKSIPIESIYKEIQQSNKRGEFKYFIPHWIYVTPDTKLELIKNGFKVYEGEWMRGDIGLIIEW